MFRTIKLAFYGFSVVGIGAWAAAQERGILSGGIDEPSIQSAEDGLGMPPINPNTEFGTEVKSAEPLALGTRNQQSAESGRYSVVAVGQGAILLNVRTGETWKLPNLTHDTWAQLERTTANKGESLTDTPLFR